MLLQFLNAKLLRHRSILHERAQKLWSEMTSLREKLNKEMALWKKEKEEFQLLRERSDVLAFEEATAAARAAVAAYAIESPLSNDLSNNHQCISVFNQLRSYNFLILSFARFCKVLQNIGELKTVRRTLL